MNLVFFSTKIFSESISVRPPIREFCSIRRLLWKLRTRSLRYALVVGAVG